MGQLEPKRDQNEVLGHFLGKYAFVFGDFAYYDWEQLCIVSNGCPSAEKKFAGPKMGQLGPKRGQN